MADWADLGLRSETAVHALRLMGAGLLINIRAADRDRAHGWGISISGLDNHDTWVRPRTHRGEARDCGLLQ
jgi:hypothetical protein